MSNNPNDKKNHLDDSSLLSAAIVSAPSVGGFGYTLQQMMKQKQFRPPRESSFASASRRIQGYDFKRGLVNTSAFGLEGQESFLRSEQGGAIAKKAWEEAVQSVGPLPPNLMNFAGNLSNTPVVEVYSSIKETLSRNDSMYMRKVASRFKSNVSSFTSHQRLTGTLPNLMKAENLNFPPSMQAHPIPTDIVPTLNRIQSSLKGYVKSEFFTRPGWEERGLGMHKFQFQVGNLGFNLNLPISHGGVLSEGLNQSTLRIAPGAAIFDKRTGKFTEMSRHALFMREFETSIVPGIVSGKYKQGFEVQRAINELYQKRIGSLENVPNLPTAMMGSKLNQFIGIRSQAVDLLIEEGDKFRSPTPRELPKLMKLGGYIGSTSPSNIAEGRVSKFDPSGWMISNLSVDQSKRLTQMNRLWTPTPEAQLEMMKTPWAIFETQQWRKDLGPHSAPRFRTLYVDPDTHPSLMKELGLEGSEALIRDTGLNRNMMKQQKTAFGVKLTSIRPDLAELIKKKKLKHGEVLGMTSEGLPFTYEKGMKLKGLEKGATEGVGEFHSLLYDELSQNTDSFKGFYNKAMYTWATPKRFEAAQAKLGAKLAGQFDVITSMDELKKQPAKFNDMMITELWNLTNKLKDTAAIQRNLKLKAFLRNPVSTARILQNKYAIKGAGGISFNQEGFTKEMLQLGLSTGADPADLGLVFGAIGKVHGKEWLQSALGQQENLLGTLTKGIAGGIAPVVYGGVGRELGVRPGAMGTIEPRIFDFLKAGQYGNLGPAMEKDILQRMAIGNADKFATHEALTKTLQSATGQVKATGAIWNQEYSSETFQNFIESGGGAIKAQGMPDIHVPGAGNVPGMSKFTTAGGQEVKTHLSQIYHDYARGVSKASSDAERSSALSNFITGIAEQHAPAGKGAGAIFRGELPGSSFLTGVSTLAGQRPSNLGEALVPEERMHSMINQLQDIYGPSTELEAMRTRVAAGESIPGAVFRHPGTEMYSLQTMNLKPVKGVKGDLMALPWEDINVKFKGEIQPWTGRFSPLVGMRGDFDADPYMPMIFHPQLSESIGKQLENKNNAETIAHMQYQVRSQIIKARGLAVGTGVEEMTTSANAIASAMKLGIAQSWTGQLSTGISEARNAVIQNLEGQKRTNALFTLGWMENVPLQGKNLTNQGLLNNAATSWFETMSSGLQERSAERLQASVGQIMGGSDLAKRLLTEDLQVESGPAGLKNLPSLNINETIGDIVGSLKKADVTGSTELYRMAAGREAISSKNVGRYIENIGNMLTPNTGGMFANISSAAQASKNYLLGLGESALEHKGAIGFGFAGSIAIATLLSTPKDTIGPGSSTNVAKAQMRQGKAVNRMDIPTQQEPHQLGTPSAPSPIVHRSMIAPGSDSVKMSIRARTGGKISNALLLDRVRSIGGRSSNVNVNIRDNTSSMDSNLLANKMFG